MKTPRFPTPARLRQAGYDTSEQGPKGGKAAARAFTLIELVAVMACMVIVGSIAMVFLFQAFDFQQRNEEHVLTRDGASRLLADFRKDVHRYGKPGISQTVPGTPEKDRLLLQWNDGDTLVVYLWEDGEFPGRRRICREVRRDGEITIFEGYILPDNAVLWCVEGRDAHAGLVALSLWVPPVGLPDSALTADDVEKIDPLTRTFPENLTREIDPVYAANWRTAVVRYAPATP